MAKVILVCGKICCGKSTYAEQLCAENKAVLLSVDEIMLARAFRMYKERSNETHEGNNLNITKEELRELRCAVRKMIQNFITFSRNQYGSITNKTFKGIKREYVIGLLARNNNLRAKGLLQQRQI